MLAELRLVRVVAWSMLLWSGKWVRGTVLGDGRATCVCDLWASSIAEVSAAIGICPLVAVKSGP
jgi:hypothetical protein